MIDEEIKHIVDLYMDKGTVVFVDRQAMIISLTNNLKQRLDKERFNAWAGGYNEGFDDALNNKDHAYPDTKDK